MIMECGGNIGKEKEMLEKNKIYEFENLGFNADIIKDRALKDLFYGIIPVTSHPQENMDYLPIKDTFQMVAMLKADEFVSRESHRDQNKINGNYGVELLIPLMFVLQKFNIPFNLDNLFKCKSNLIFTKQENEGEFIHTPHVDMDDDNIWTMIYFLEDNNGYTYFFNRDENNKLKTFQKIKPEKGKSVFFHSSIYHAGSSCTDHDVRAVINYNYRLDPRLYPSK